MCFFLLKASYLGWSSYDQEAVPQGSGIYRGPEWQTAWTAALLPGILVVPAPSGPRGGGADPRARLCRL